MVDVPSKPPMFGCIDDEVMADFKLIVLDPILFVYCFPLVSHGVSNIFANILCDNFTFSERIGSLHQYILAVQVISINELV